MTHRPCSAAPLLVLFVLILLAPQASVAQGPASTPREAMLAYLDACRRGDYERAARYLNTQGLASAEAEAEGPRLARQLKIVLDQKLWIDPEQLSAEPGGDPDDGLEDATDRVGAIQTARGDVPILLERVASPDPEWRIAAETVARVPELWDAFGYGPLAEFLPESFFAVRFLEVELWQWIGLLALAVLSWLVALVVEVVLLRAVRRTTQNTATQLDDQLIAATASPLVLTLSATAFYAGSFALFLAAPAHRVVSGLAGVVVIASVTWLAFRVVNAVGGTIDVRLAERGEAAGRTMIQMGSRVVKAFLFVIALLGTLHTLGYNVTTVLAGLGIGGLAVALAAQKTFENFFGGLSILMDRPVQVGHFCRFGDKVGTIEEIGLRSTRVRSLDRTLITVPNAEFATLQLENFAARDRIRFTTVIGLRYETSAEQMRWILIELKKLLLSHPRVTPDPARIRFIGFGASSLDLELFAYVNTSDWNEFLGIREDLLLRIMDVIEAGGSSFAFPSSTVYVGRDDGLDGERIKAAEEQVRDWREQSALALPDFPTERARELDDTLPYPPEGSALAGPARA